VHHHGAHQLLQALADPRLLMEVHERGADADRPSRRGARVSALARPASASRAAGPHAQQSTSRSTQRLSLVYSSSLLYTCCTPTPYGVHPTRGECSASGRCVLGLAYRSSYGFICHAARPLSASILFGRGCAGKQCAWAMRGVVSSQRGGGASKLCEQLQLVAARVGAHLTPLRRGSSHLRRSRKIPCAA
jgi:hypothetical protein